MKCYQGGWRARGVVDDEFIGFDVTCKPAGHIELGYLLITSGAGLRPEWAAMDDRCPAGRSRANASAAPAPDVS